VFKLYDPHSAVIRTLLARLATAGYWGKEKGGSPTLTTSQRMYFVTICARNLPNCRVLVVSIGSKWSQSLTMETMQITVISVVECDNHFRARARAVARDARIMIEVRFQTDEEASTADHWERARDEVLRYLDIA